MGNTRQIATIGLVLSMLSPGAWSCLPSENVTLLAHIPLEDFSSNPGSGNDCWGYTSSSGREYGLMGLRNAVAVIDITTPSFPVVVGEIPHSDSNWGDVKAYGDHGYAVNENGGGMDVIDLSDADNGNVTLVQRVTTAGLSAAHNIAIDTTSGFLYLCGSNVNQGRLVVFDLADPANPVLVGQMDPSQGEYVHDAQVVTYPNGTQIAFAAIGGLGLDIYDVTDKANMFRIAQTTYPNLSYAHQCWSDESRSFLYLNDETDSVNETVIFDISDLTTPFIAGTYDSGVEATDHNLYVHEGLIYEAEYRAGVRIFDASDPVAPVQVGYLDTFPDDDNPGSGGAWSVYPFFPSGNFIVGDKSDGFFVARYGPAPIVFDYPAGLPDRVDPPGTAVTVQITAQEGQTLDTTSPALHFTRGGGVVDVPMQALGNGLYRGTLGPLDCGTFTQYWVSAATTTGILLRDPSTAPCDANLAISAFASTVELDEPLEGQPHWTVGAPGDDATSGVWVLVDPVATEGQPENDRTPDPGTQCFVTGQGTLQDVTGENDVDEGVTTLTTPRMNLGLLDDATISYWLWYDNDFSQIDSDEGGGPNEDVFVAQISDDDGDTWAPLETVGPAGAGTSGGWVLRAFRVSDLVALTGEVRLRFIASDLGAPSVVEAAIDDLQVTAISCSAAGAGRVPNGDAPAGEPLRLTLGANDDITLQWSASCLGSDTDYAIYEGMLGDFASHLPKTCSTTGLTTASITPAPASSYYVVVPLNGSAEGSYGATSDGVDRPESAIACLPQVTATCP